MAQPDTEDGAGVIPGRPLSLNSPRAQSSEGLFE